MNDFITLWATFGVWFYDLLPNSPFQQFNTIIGDTISPYIGYVNWFIPVDWILTLLLVWLGAIASFYLVQSVGRWLKVLGD